jgi:hypothetical protein
VDNKQGGDCVRSPQLEIQGLGIATCVAEYPPPRRPLNRASGEQVVEAECIMKCLLLGTSHAQFVWVIGLKAPCKVAAKICCAITGRRAAWSPVLVCSKVRCLEQNEPWVRSDAGGDTRLVRAFWKANTLSGRPKLARLGRRHVGYHQETVPLYLPLFSITRCFSASSKNRQ